MTAPSEILRSLGYDELGNAPHLLNEHDCKRIACGDFIRCAGAEVICDCGSPYILHPVVQGALWLRRVCPDTLVKL
jgi:hypothetical protein